MWSADREDALLALDAESVSIITIDGRNIIVRFFLPEC